MEISPEDLYEIYLRLAEEQRQEPPIDLDAIWTTLRESNYLRQRGCIVQDAPDGATQTAIANPSTWVRPSLDIAAPYGFKGISDRVWGEAALRRYLAAKITVLLGQEDVGSRNLATSEEAEEQGSTRFERGQNVFREAEAAARRNGWQFNWHLAVVPGIGHSARSMFGSVQALDALRP